MYNLMKYSLNEEALNELIEADFSGLTLLRVKILLSDLLNTYCTIKECEIVISEVAQAKFKTAFKKLSDTAFSLID